MKKEKFVKLLSVPSDSNNEHSMVDYITTELKAMGVGYYIDAIGNIIAKKGDRDQVVPCICCHMDTVHQHPGRQVPVLWHNKDKDTVYSSPLGVGGDDKCGIFIALEMLRVSGAVKAIFFTQEESGQVGSSNIDIGDALYDCSYMIEADRKGPGDMIDVYGGDTTVGENFSKKVQPIAKKFGYKSTEGVFTDVMILFERGLNIPVMNLSCGYYNAHTKSEYISWNEMRNAFNFIREIFSKVGSGYHINESGGLCIQKTTNRFANSYGWDDDDEYCASCGIELYPNEEKYCNMCAEYFRKTAVK